MFKSSVADYKLNIVPVVVQGYESSLLGRKWLKYTMLDLDNDCNNQMPLT